jgi:hypothetical protein
MDLRGVNPWLVKLTDNTPSPLENVKMPSIKHTRLEQKYTSATFFAEYHTRQCRAVFSECHELPNTSKLSMVIVLSSRLLHELGVDSTVDV